MSRATTLAVISDTHARLRESVRDRLQGCARIVHAGDVGSDAVLDELRAIAPLTVVRGNVDRCEWAGALPFDEVVNIDGCLLYVLHDIGELSLDPGPEGAGFAAVIYGHSHRPHAETKNGVLYLNPGSVGPRRFSLPISMAWLTIENGRIATVAFEQFDD